MNEILLYGPIGFDLWEPENSITARSVMNQLAEVQGDVTVRISSGGGDVYEGIDIMSALKNHDGYVTVIVESLAASAASFIAAGGGDRVLLRPTSEMMVHRAWTWAEGNADQVRQTLGDLERQDVKLANIYAAKAGGTVDDWLAAMSAETWYNADEAVAAGLADGMVESAKPVEARRVPMISASRKRFKYQDRSSAPPPKIVRRSASSDKNNKPSDGQEGVTMDILNQLAQELGKKPEDVRNALSDFLNESVSVSGEVEVTYPAETLIAPTERITVDPTIGDAGDGGGGLGLTYEMGDVADGYTAEVNETNGQVTITAPANVEIGAVANFTVNVSGTAVSLSTKVRSLSEEAPGTEPAPTAPPTGPPASPDNSMPKMIQVDSDTYAELKAAANFGWNSMQEKRKKDLESEVDTWIKDGRISAALRSKAVAAIKASPDNARASFGANPKGTIPRREIGHGFEELPDNDTSSDIPQGTPEERIAAYAAMAKNK